MKMIDVVLLLLRFAVGFLFLTAGMEKIKTYVTSEPDWTAEKYLITTGKPFFASMAGSGVVDFLVVWGMVMIGISLITGFLMRYSAFYGAVMMMLFYLSVFPPEHGIINEHIIYSLVLLMFMVSDINYYGLDGIIRKERFFKKYGWDILFE